MQQVRHHVNVRLICDPNKLAKAVSRLTFRCAEIINNDLTLVRGARQRVTLNKPISVCFSILKISKLVMYEFYYDHLKAKYSDRCKLLFTDTTPFAAIFRQKTCTKTCQKTWTCSILVILKPPIHCIRLKHRVLSKFKSENGSLTPLEFVGLRAKMYSLLVPDNRKKIKN